ncbi:unnamed protein product [Pleuronectes platessa]|uniref:Uncharacterized protein n=1 Tax=Pleuronectes platessa TaxID=8262 RepID=A0A9N7TXQ7_PLEPL|nr:unnamed protein product [Pleuronectes platessa]
MQRRTTRELRRHVNRSVFTSDPELRTINLKHPVLQTLRTAPPENTGLALQTQRTSSIHHLATAVRNGEEMGRTEWVGRLEKMEMETIEDGDKEEDGRDAVGVRWWGWQHFGWESRYMALDHPPPSSNGGARAPPFLPGERVERVSSLLLPVRHLSGHINMPIVEAETPGTPLNVNSTVWKDAAAVPAPAPAAGLRWGAGALAARLRPI